MQAYGPFLDEQLFHFTDKTVLTLDKFQLYDTSREEYIGFDDLQVIYDKGREGNFNRIFFTGIAVLEKVDILCQQGFDVLYEAVQSRHPTMTPAGFGKRCKEGEIMIEILCQLKFMPVAYLTRIPANSILVYSNNFNNFNRQRCYIVNTIHIICFSQSEQTLQFAMVEKFIMDAALRYKKTQRNDRTVHWLVDRYVAAYNKVFRLHQRPSLHRATVYDYFAVYAELLENVLTHKIFPMSISKWRVWVADARLLRDKTEAAGSVWGTIPLGRLRALPEEDPEEAEHDSNRESPTGMNMMDLGETGLYHDRIENEFNPSESSSEEEDVPYNMDPALTSFMQRRLLKRMPLPEWFWECDIDPDCLFVINLNRAHRTADAPYMAKLSEAEKTYLVGSSWRLSDRKVRRIWKKICQNHWEDHMEQAGLFVDHVNKRIIRK